LKSFRSHSGGEFTFGQFNQFCNENDILRQLKILYIPQQNVVVEKKNHILIKSVRNMFFNARISKMFWTKTIALVTYVQKKYSHMQLGT
jgi:hypothetical protein